MLLKLLQLSTFFSAFFRRLGSVCAILHFLLANYTAHETIYTHTRAREKARIAFSTSIEFSHGNCYPFSCRGMEVIYCYVDIVDSKIESRNRQSVEQNQARHKHILWHRICIADRRLLRSPVCVGVGVCVCVLCAKRKKWKTPTQFLSGRRTSCLQHSALFRLHRHLLCVGFLRGKMLNFSLYDNRYSFLLLTLCGLFTWNR